MKRFLLFFLLLTSTISFSQVCNYKYNRRIKIDHTKVSGGVDLTNFPVYITTVGLGDQNLFKSVANAGHVQSGSGYDIIFTAADGVTPLSFQMDNYVATTGEYEAWVNIPTLSHTVDTYIYIYYGDAAIVADQSSTATWNANYMSVFHFGNFSNTSDYNDKTSYALAGTQNGGITETAATAPIGYKSDNYASNQYVDVAGGASDPFNLTTNITVSAWVKFNATGNDQKIAGNQDGGTRAPSVNGGWKFGVFSDDHVEFEVRNGGTPWLNRNI